MLSQEKINLLALQVGGELAAGIVQFLIDNGENISEFLISEKLDVEINQIRKALYILQENNLVNSMRKKDKKKGWYIYYWTFDPIQAETMVVKMKRERIKSLKKRLENETITNFYACKRSCIRMTYERALDHNYICPECGKIMEEVDNSKKVSLIKKELALLETPEEIMEEPEKAEAAA